ncbi:MAG: hypothetical protein VZS44_00205 [Bacilli bacterium]|nr:hypothetical protein [Bacilli bacterium]
MDEDKKKKLKNVVYRLKVICNKIEDLEKSVSKVNGTIKKNITVDGKGLKEGTLNNINKELKDRRSTIRNSIIPSLNNKINNP